MSTEPRRLIDEGPDDLRELLSSAQLDEPTAAQLERLTLKVSFLFPIVPGGGGGDGGDGGGGGTPGGGGHAPGGGAVGVGAVAAKAGLSVASFKTAALVLAASVAVGGGGVAAVRSVTERTVTPVLQPVEQAIAKPEPVAEQAPEAPVFDEPQPVPESPKRPPPPPKVSEPTEDALMAEAVQLARSGKAEAALSRADQLAARYPAGVMVQEREVVAIEALVSLERVDEARARATAFRQKWPTSAHITKVDALVHVGE